MITWRTVESSNVASIGWPQDVLDVQSQITDALAARIERLYWTWRPPLLLVRFKDGKCYGYLGVSQQRSVYIATRCPSVGRYIERVIKPKFSVVRIPSLDVVGAPY